MMANYNSQEAVDNDDGSSYYHTHHNYLVYGDAGTLTLTLSSRTTMFTVLWQKNSIRMFN
jgi:hypothetical protein